MAKVQLHARYTDGRRIIFVLSRSLSAKTSDVGDTHLWETVNQNLHSSIYVPIISFVALLRSAACVFAKEGTLVAYVSAHKYNIRNWWTGSWSGR